jgi:hypothetical protein
MRALRVNHIMGILRAAVIEVAKLRRSGATGKVVRWCG